MAKKPVTTGKALERQVADASRAMDARRVEHDVELAGEESTPIGRSDDGSSG